MHADLLEHGKDSEETKAYTLRRLREHGMSEELITALWSDSNPRTSALPTNS